MKLTFILAVLLILTVLGSTMYIKYLNSELTVVRANQAILERTIQDQNEQIKQALEQAKKTAQQIQTLNNQYSASQAQVTKLRNKFANFNLEGMAMTEPAVLQGKVNRATARVIENLNTITNPDQFDEEANTNTATN
jgi:peptidoglycan hydrolase CwlO-like protein